MKLGDKYIFNSDTSGLLPELWIPVIEVKMNSTFFLSRSLWWQNKDGSFFREEWNEEIGNIIELTNLFEDQETRKSSQILLNLLRPEYQSIFGNSMTFVYCPKVWKTLLTYSQKVIPEKQCFETPQLSTVFLYNPIKNTFDPLIETKPM